MGTIVGRGQSKLQCDFGGCSVESEYVNGEFDGQRAVEPVMQKRGWQCLSNGKTYCPDHAYGGTLKPNASVTGAVQPRTLDAVLAAVLAEVQSSADLAWEHAQQQEAAGNAIRAEWFKGRSVALGEVVQAIRKANSAIRLNTAGDVPRRNDVGGDKE